MRHLVVLFIHFLATLVRLLGPGGVRSIVAESLLLKHQLLLLNRGFAYSRQRGAGAHRRFARPSLHGTHFSVSSGVGFLALFGVSVQTGVIMLEYINQLRVQGHSIEDSAIEGAVLRLRPIMMTMLVATLGLLPAALSHAIGSDSQRPFAIVIVGGLISDLVMSIFLLPTLYVWVSRQGDKLPELEQGFEANGQ
jgi:hypothetical protein